MKLWIDDVRPAPKGYKWIQTVNEAKQFLAVTSRLSGIICPPNEPYIELISVDHDAGDCAVYGGDYIELVKWMEQERMFYPIRIHSMNPVGVQNIRRIIEKYPQWKEIR